MMKKKKKTHVGIVIVKNATSNLTTFSRYRMALINAAARATIGFAAP
jgi:hypothetical protein